MDSQKFRKHPGGIASWIKWTKRWIGFALIAGIVLLPVSLFTQLQGIAKANITYFSPVKEGEKANGFLLTKNVGAELELVDPSFLDRLLFDSVGPWSFLMMLLSLLTTWQLYRIFNRLELNRPFHMAIPKYIKYIGVILIASSALSALRVYYMDRAVKSLTQGQCHLTYRLYFDDLNGLKVDVLVLIIAAVYQYGCKLQHEQDLTI